MGVTRTVATGLLVTATAGAAAAWGARAVLQHQAALARAAIGKPLGEDAPLADQKIMVIKAVLRLSWTAAA